MIRKFTSADLDTYMSLRVESNTPVTESEAKKLIKSFIKSDIQEGLYEFILEYDEKTVGQISFYEAGKNTYEIGIQILEVYKNMGYATKAINAVKNGNSGITFIANVDKSNTPSIKLFNEITNNKCESKDSIQFVINT